MPSCVGSSAGAGSEVYHVYRHLRRKELTRQKFIEEKALSVSQTSGLLIHTCKHSIVSDLCIVL